MVEEITAPSANSNTNWVNPTNAYADNDTYATCATTDGVCVWYGYSFTIPTNSTITKVEVGLFGASCSGNDNIDIAVSKDGGSSFSSYYAQTVTKTITDYWIDMTSYRTGWTYSDFNTSNNFRVRLIQAKLGGLDSVSVDYIPVRVTYTTFAVPITKFYFTFIG